MRKLYGPTSWRRVLAFILVFAMLFSVAGTSRWSVYADEDLPEAEEELVETPATEEEVSAPEEEAEPIAGTEESAEPEADETEALPEEVTEEPAEEAEPVEEEAEEAAEPAGEAEAPEEEAVEEPAEQEEEPAEEAAPAEAEAEAEPADEAVTEEAPAEESAEEDAAEEAPAEPEEEPAGTIVEEFVKGLDAEPAEDAEDEETAEPAEEAEEAAEPAEESEEAAVPAEAEAPAAESAAEPETAAEEEPEITYPKAKFRDIIGGISVTVKAPAGAFPDGTEMKLAEVEIETILDAVTDAVDGEISKIKAVDISFFYKGEEVQPLVPISVTMNASGMDADGDRQVLHIDESGSEPVAEVIESADTSEKAVVFEADSFSVYVVIETVVPRYFVTFMNGDTQIAEMIVKGSDTADEVDTIIYDPGAGEIPEGQVFKGWTTNNQYTAETELLTIDDVRTAAMTAVDQLEYDGYVTYYAAIFKQYNVSYIDANGISVGTDVALTPSRETNAPYTVNMGYTTDDNHNFEGWHVAEGLDNIVEPEGLTEETLIPNDTDITINGDIELSVIAPEGHWLIFDENGKGATYVAPQFVKADTVTVEPVIEMARYGYIFDGWYTGKPESVGADPAGEIFEFGHEISNATTIYAKWKPKEDATYTVIFWTQNLARDGYEVAGSFVGTEGVVDQNIPYSSVENDDEDYAVVTGSEGGHYTGFCLTDASKDQQVKIKPEGDSVLNLYYDRIEYDFKFYLYRTPGANGNAYSYANNSDDGETLGDLVTWHNSNNHPGVADGTGYSIVSEPVTIGNANYTYYYFTIHAFYGQDISKDWPTYDKIVGADNRDPVSYVMMVGTKLKPSGTDQGSGTVKGVISVLDENILGATNDSKGNYVIVRFPGGTVNNWRYHIWLEAVEGEDYGNKPTHEYNGKTYYKDTVMVVRSSNTQVSSQNEPNYNGFDFVEKRGENWDNSTYWTSTEDNTTLYNLNYVYNRQQFKISYFDGLYVDGDNKMLQSRSTQLLHESDAIGQGAEIPEEYSGYTPKLPAGEAGFVFEGWYVDEGCTVPYTWDKMTIGGIRVYAKWRQIQYRVFLHPEADKDVTLTWGGDNQQMCFRVSYGGQISAPTGKRTGYEFYGWYWPNGSVFNETTKITSGTAYDKTKDFTDPMDKWGVLGKDPINTDITGNNGKDRFWVTQRVDLYAKWGEVIVGASGIAIVYDANGGTNAPADSLLHKDNTVANAGAAATAPSGKVFDHWVVQTWNGTAYEDTETEVLPGVEFTVFKKDAKITNRGTDDVVDPDDVVETGKYDYTLQLKAVYKDIEEETPTHINWYSNYGSDNDGSGTLYQSDSDIKINEAVLIYGFENETESWTIPARAGYKFLGWTKTKGGTEADFLIWDEEGEGYLTGIETDEEDPFYAYLVAADEKQPYEDLYAVWEPIEVNYTVEFYYQSEDGTSYVKDEQMTDVRSATTETTVAAKDEDKAQTKEDKYNLVEGSPSVLSAVVAGDGSTVLKLYFNLKGMNLKIEKAVSNEPANGEAYALGETIQYQITVTNDGDVTVNKFVVVDEMTGDEIEVDSLAPGKFKTFDVAYTVTEEDILEGEIVNVATVKPQSPVDPPDTPVTPPEVPDIPVTPHDPVIVIPEDPNAHITITKDTAGDQPEDKIYAKGEQILFEVTVTNDGNLTITNIVVTDELTKDEWTIEELKPGESQTFACNSYTVTLQDAIEAKVINKATGTGEGPDEDHEPTIEEGIKEVEIVPIGKTINVSFFTNYPAGVTLENEYTDTMTVEVPYTVPGFVEVFDESMLAPDYEFTGWEIHTPGEAAEANGGAVVPAASSSLASASSSSQKTEPKDADFIFYAQWNPIEAPGPDPGGGNDPEIVPNPPRPNPPKEPDEPGEPEPPTEEPDDEIVDDGPPLANYEEEPDEDIVEEPTPLSPYTGDDRHTAVWSVISLLSLAGIAVLARKRKEE